MCTEATRKVGEAPQRCILKNRMPSSVGRMYPDVGTSQDLKQ